MGNTAGLAAEAPKGPAKREQALEPRLPPVLCG